MSGELDRFVRLLPKTAILAIWTASPMASAGLFSPRGPLGTSRPRKFNDRSPIFANKCAVGGALFYHLFSNRKCIGKSAIELFFAAAIVIDINAVSPYTRNPVAVAIFLPTHCCTNKTKPDDQHRPNRRLGDGRVEIVEYALRRQWSPCLEE